MSSMTQERVGDTARPTNGWGAPDMGTLRMEDLYSRADMSASFLQRDVDEALDNSGPESGASFPFQEDPPRPLPATTLAVSGLSTWSGRVLDIDEEFFSAELVPDSNTPGDTVVADFKLSLLDEPDGTLRIGDVVYLTSRVVRTLHGRKTETASVRLRRLGAWSAAEIEEIREEGREMFAGLQDLLD